MTRTPVRPGTRNAGESRWVDLADGPVHYVDHGGPEGAPLTVLVHGLGGSHANWAAMAPLLTGTHRVVAVDLAGFGLTTAGVRPSSVTGNADLLHRFVTALSPGPAILVGNSMGGMISAMVAVEHPESVSRLVLIDPVLPLTAALPDRTVTGNLLQGMLPLKVRMAIARRRDPIPRSRAAMELVTLCCDDPDRVPEDVIDVHLALAERRGYVEETARDFLMAGRSMVLTFVRARRYARMLASIQAPVLLIHGTRDRLVPIRVARVAAAANPGWTFAPGTSVGHVPMLEAPRWTAERILEWVTDSR
jgi:pimeloyl-ACP methyl ester carboxylesterase